MRILSINAQSWNTTRKSVSETVDINNIDLLCISETWESTEKQVKFRNWSVISRPRANNSGYGGVAVAYKPSEYMYVVHRPDLERANIELICVEITLRNGLTFLLFTVYVPPKDCLDQLESVITCIGDSRHSNVVITGDMNAKSLEWGNKYYNVYGRHWEEFLYQRKLLCVNDCVPTKKHDESVIDLFVVNANLVPEVSVCCTLTHELVRSDHVPVLLDIGRCDEEVKRADKFLIGKTDWDQWSELSEKEFGNWIKDNQGNQWDSVEELYDSFKSVFDKCRDACVPKKLVSCNGRRISPLWMTEEVKAARQVLNAAKKGYKRRSTDQNYAKLEEAKRLCEECELKAKDLWVDKMCDKLSNTKDSRELWECFRKLTSYKCEDECDVLPLLDKNNTPQFAGEEKSKILQETFFSGNHLVSNNFDDVFRVAIESEFKDICESLDTPPVHQHQSLDTSSLNQDITRDETAAVLKSLVKGKASGPDWVFSELLLSAGDNLITAIHKLFQFSLAEGEIPQDWKSANVKFIKKAGKKSYHSASAYRPISLTSCLGKSLEKILTTRLYNFAEHHHIIDKEQEGFRRCHSTTQALTRIIQTIFDAFNSNQYTLAAFVDLEKAYDSVWREGLLVKMHRLGITGNIWKWLRDFLGNRFATCRIQGALGNTFTTSVGLPQGSVISPLLFNIFIRDIFANVAGSKVKFADDGSILHTGSALNNLTNCLEIDLESVATWAEQWRLNINTDKTEVCLFKRPAADLDTPLPKVHVRGKLLPYNVSPKVLGVYLDEQLNFKIHIEKTEQRATRALALLRAVKETEKVSTKRLLQLYKTIVTPYLEYASSAWQTSPHCSKLDSIQRKALAMCLGCTGTSGREALEVELNIPPLDIRRDELSIREFGKILAKQDMEPLKRKLLDWQSIDTPERYLSPFGAMALQAEELTKTTNIQLHRIEPECSFLYSLQLSSFAPDYWSSLGSSKSRSKLQETEAKQIINHMLETCSPRTVVAFTDGSCQPNPGPCGAGACIMLPGQNDTVELSKPVSPYGSILLGELIGILITLEFIVGELDSASLDNVQIFSDSQSAIGLLTLGWKPSQYHTSIRSIKSLITQLNSANIEVNIDWTPGHAHIAGNDRADTLAKQASGVAATLDDKESITSQGDIKSGARETALSKWQRRWELADTGRRLYRFKDQVSDTSLIDYPNRKIYSTIAQLRSGYIGLNEYYNKLGVVPSPLCDYCKQPESVSHFLLTCEKYELQRERLITNMFNVCGVGTLSEDILLCVGEKDEHKEHRRDITLHLGEFFTQTERF